MVTVVVVAIGVVAASVGLAGGEDVRSTTDSCGGVPEDEDPQEGKSPVPRCVCVCVFTICLLCLFFFRILFSFSLKDETEKGVGCRPPDPKLETTRRSPRKKVVFTLASLQMCRWRPGTYTYFVYVFETAFSTVLRIRGRGMHLTSERLCVPSSTYQFVDGFITLDNTMPPYRAKP